MSLGNISVQNILSCNKDHALEIWSGCSILEPENCHEIIRRPEKIISVLNLKTDH
jgi:hypothetical protein